MRAKIDKKFLNRVRMINSALEGAEMRHYYLLKRTDGQPDAIIVSRAGPIEALREAVVDVNIGWDIAQPGFAREEDLGKKRTKVTIYRKLRGRFASKLSDLIN